MYSSSPEKREIWKQKKDIEKKRKRAWRNHNKKCDKKQCSTCGGLYKQYLIARSETEKALHQWSLTYKESRSRFNLM